MYLVKPKTSDLVLIGPDGRRVPDAGITVPELTLFWRRREADGDAVITDAPPETETAPEPKKKG
jgi:hypothetical protein